MKGLKDVLLMCSHYRLIVKYNSTEVLTEKLLLSFLLLFLFTVRNDEEEKVETEKQMKEGSPLKSTHTASVPQGNKTNVPTDEEDMGHCNAASSIPSVSSFVSTAAVSPSNHRSLRRSTASSCEGAGPANTMGGTTSHGRLSSCSTVMITEEHLMLNPVKAEVGFQHVEGYAALYHVAD